MLIHVKKVFQVSNLYKRLMYKCSAVQQPLSNQQNVHCKLQNYSESTFVFRNDIENGDFRHPSSLVFLIYKTVPARKQKIKQQKEKFMYPTPVQEDLSQKCTTTERQKSRKRCLHLKTKQYKSQPNPLQLFAEKLKFLANF